MTAADGGEAETLREGTDELVMAAAAAAVKVISQKKGEVENGTIRTTDSSISGVEETRYLKAERLRRCGSSTWRLWRF